MRIELNKIQAFEFTNPFSSLDNIYNVTHVMNHSEIIKTDVNMVALLYLKVGKTASDWQNDLPSYINDKFYKLELVNTLIDNVIYVPESIIKVYPNSNIAKYNNTMLLFDLGIFDNPTVLIGIRDKIKDLLIHEVGIDTDPLLAAYGDQWLTKDVYAQLEANRESTKSAVANLYSTNRKLTDEIAKANQRIQALEQIITTL